ENPLTRESCSIALASSIVNFFRFTTSGGRRPPIVGGMRCTKIRLEPRSSIWEAMLVLRPLMIDDMPMTVATPITTPSTVRNERSLFFRNESSASRRISLIAQRHYRIEIRRFCGGIDSEEKPDARGHSEAERNRPPFDGSRKRCEM